MPIRAAHRTLNATDDPAASDPAAGQAVFEMANLCPERTGLPFVVFISQRGGARHDVRIKLARSPRVRPSEMITVALRPMPCAIRGRLDASEFELLRRWLGLNVDVLVDYRNGVIEYTDDAIDALKPLSETEHP